MHGPPIPSSREFEQFARGAQFRDRIAIPVRAPADAIFTALREVSLRDMKLAWALGALRDLPARLSGRVPATDSRQPFLSLLQDRGTLILRDSPVELITGSAGQLHRVRQSIGQFPTAEAFESFADPDHEKLFIGIRTEPTGNRGEHWLVLEHATRALSPEAERKFAWYWRVIKPLGAFVSGQLLRAIRRRAEREEVTLHTPATTRTVRAAVAERLLPLPGDRFIAEAASSITHAISIDRSASEVWPWLAQMGAGNRGGWYSYDLLDNGRQRSADRIIPELQHLTLGMVFPAAPGVTDAFTLLAYEPQRYLVLGGLPADRPVMTWAFVLTELTNRSCRLVVRARVSDRYRFGALPRWLSRPVGRLVHFVMQRRQLLGIKRRAETMGRQMAPGHTPTGRRNAA
jgi:hypothetical protein